MRIIVLALGRLGREDRGHPGLCFETLPRIPNQSSNKDKVNKATHTPQLKTSNSFLRTRAQLVWAAALSQEGRTQFLGEDEGLLVCPEWKLLAGEDGRGPSRVDSLGLRVQLSLLGNMKTRIQMWSALLLGGLARVELNATEYRMASWTVCLWCLTSNRLILPW